MCERGNKQFLTVSEWQRCRQEETIQRKTYPWRSMDLAVLWWAWKHFGNKWVTALKQGTGHRFSCLLRTHIVPICPLVAWTVFWQMRSLLIKWWEIQEKLHMLPFLVKIRSTHSSVTILIFPNKWDQIVWSHIPNMNCSTWNLKCKTLIAQYCLYEFVNGNLCPF